jgi:hypothetical protein
MKNISILFFLMVTILTSPVIDGCATILKGSIEKVDIASDPNGAKVYINGQLLGKTPLQIRLPVNKTHYIEFVREGYEKKTVVLSGSVGGGWVILDILFGLIPVVIDAATGSWYQLDENYARVYLEKQNGSRTEPSTDLPNVAPGIIQNEPPPFFAIDLKSREAQTILEGRVSLIFESAAVGKSSLSAKGIWGFSQENTGPFDEMSIRVSKAHAVFLRIDERTVYRVVVVQEVWNVISLEFTKF